MITKIQIVRAAMVAVALSLTVPVVSKLVAQPQSGYMVAWAPGGFLFCPDGPAQECI